MKFINILKVEFRRSILNPLFWGTIVLSCALFFMSGYEEFVYYAPMAENLDVYHFFDILRNVGTFESMLIVCCAIPYAVSFCVDYNATYLRFIKVRTGENRYIISRVLACGVSGSLSIALGILLFLSLVGLNYPLVDVDGGLYQSAIMRLSYAPEALDILLFNENYVLYFAISIYLIFLVGFMWSVIGLSISAIIPNPFVALFSPFLLFFLQDTFLQKLPSHFKTINIMQGRFNVGGVVTSVIYATVFIGLLVFLTTLVFGYFCKRRMRDELH